MITKKLIKPISKVGVANVDLDNYYTKPQIDSKLDAKQDTLIAGSNITIQGNVISANVNGSGSGNVDLSNYYNKQEIDTTINSVKGNITTNTSDIANIKTQQATQDQQISSNRDLSNQIIEGLKTLRVFNYIGTFNSQTTYKRNDVVDYNNRLFLSKVDNNVGNTPPSDNQSNTYWLLVDGIQASVDLSGYYTKLEVDNKLQDYLAITTFNNTIQQINTKQQEQDTLISQKANTSDLDNYYTKAQVDSKVDTINSEITTINNGVNDLTTKVETNTNSINTINNNTPNYVVKNATNTITTDNFLNKSNNGSLSLVKMNWRAQKTLSYDYIQDSGSFRNYITHKITLKHLNNPISTLFVLETRNTNQGVFIGCENNLLTFMNGTTINNVATPTSDNQCANKAYVDSQIANIPQVDLSNYYNKQEIDTTINSVKGNVATNTNDITTLKAKDTQLENTINTNKQNITTNTSDIANIKTQQATQDQQISSNRDLSNQIIEGLKTLRVFNYIGTFNSQTTYKRNDVVDYNNRLFLSKVDNNVGNTPPSDNQSNTYWLLVDGIQASVDLSGYYTKLEVDNKLQDYLAITTFNNTIQQINTKQQEQDTLISQKANTSDLDNYYNKSEVDSKVETINNEVNTKQDILTAGNNITISNNVISANVPQVDLSDYYTKTQIDGKVDTINNELNGYAKINESNNGQFYIGNKNSKHIWFSQPFQYSGNTYSSMKIRNGNTNYFTMEHNFNTNQSIISNPSGSIQLKNVATPTENSDGVNKAYVDTKIANIPSTDLTNYYTKSEIDTKISEVDAKIDWEVVPSTSIIRANNATTIPLNGKRWVHLQGRFTQFTTSTGRYYNFTPITLDTQNYHYVVRFPIFDWNTQAVVASIECDVENDNLILRAHNTSNQLVAYYLWGDVLVK